MKTLLIAALSIALLLPTLAWAGPPLANNTSTAADVLIKTGAGTLHAVTCSGNDAAATAGTIIFYDNTAESGTVLLYFTIAAAALTPFTLTPDLKFATGLYAGFTTTTDVICHVSWR